MKAWPVVAALVFSSAPLQAQDPEPPDMTCSSGSLYEIAYTARFGTEEDVCGECVDAALNSEPQPDGCQYSQWDTRVQSSLDPLTLPKFSPPSPDAQLVRAELSATATLCGVLRVGHRVPLNPCEPTVALSSILEVEPAVDSATGLTVPGLPAFGQLRLDTESTFWLEAFDGTVDFEGPSGVTWIVPAQTVTDIRHTSTPTVLVDLTDGSADGVTEQLVFEHSAVDASSTTICGPLTFLSDPFAGLELTIRYFYCDATSFCDGADGALAACPCGNPGEVSTGCDVGQGTGGVRLGLVAQATSPENRATWSGMGYPTAGTPAALVLRSDEATSAVVFGAACAVSGRRSSASARPSPSPAARPTRTVTILRPVAARSPTSSGSATTRRATAIRRLPSTC